MQITHDEKERVYNYLSIKTGKVIDDQYTYQATVRGVENVTFSFYNHDMTRSSIYIIICRRDINSVKSTYTTGEDMTDINRQLMKINFSPEDGQNSEEGGFDEQFWDTINVIYVGNHPTQSQSHLENVMFRDSIRRKAIEIHRNPPNKRGGKFSRRQRLLRRTRRARRRVGAKGSITHVK